MAKEKKKAKAKTGNCWDKRHHTCDGFGKKRKASGIVVYICSCKCHADNIDKIKSHASKWESAQKGMRK